MSVPTAMSGQGENVIDTARAAVRGECKSADTTHCLDRRELRIEQLVHELAKDEHTEQPHHRCLGHRGSRFPQWTSRNDVETETIDERVAEHVEGVGE